MALDLSGFQSSEQKFGGLYNLGEQLKETRHRSEQLQQRDVANSNSMSKFLTDYLDPKEHLSGSPYDPEITKGYMDLIQEGASLIKDNKGISTDMLLTALSGKANKLARYASKAKIINDNIKNTSGQAGVGIDKMALIEQARKNAFYNEDRTRKDIDAVDDAVDWTQEAIRKSPEYIFNNKGLDEWISENQKSVNTTTVMNKNSRGGVERRKVKTTAYDWAVPSTDDGGVNDRTFEPKFDHAYDGDTPILHDGKKVKLLDNGLYKSILGNSPDAANWLRGQVNLALKSGEYKDVNGKPMTINSPHIDVLGKAILYDELKNRGGLGGMEDEVQHIADKAVSQGGGGRKESASEISKGKSINNLHLSLNDAAMDSNGDLDATDLLAGINILSSVDKRPLQFKNVLFNPDTKVFTFKKEDGEEKIPYHKLASLAATANSNVDREWLEGFNTYSRSKSANNVPQETPKKEKGYQDVIGGWMKKGVEVLKGSTGNQALPQIQKGKSKSPTSADNL
jgi:hypothetical protein